LVRHASRALPKISSFHQTKTGDAHYSMRQGKYFWGLLICLLGFNVSIYGGINGGTALSFNGANNYVSVPVVNLSTNNAMTLEAWIKPADLTNSAYSEIIRQQGPGATDWLLAFQTNGTRLTFGLRAGGTLQQLAVPINATNYVDGNWHHIAATYDGLVTSLYRDGALIGSLSQTGAISFAGSAAAIGASYNGSASEFFNGVIDEVRVWNIARSAAQIKLYMGQSLAGTETGLAAYWRFDEGTGTAAGDSTGNGHNGTLINSPVWVVSTAPIGIPLVTTLPATSINTNSATFNGSVNPNGFDTGVYFQYGNTTNYGNQTFIGAAGSSSNAVSILVTATNLLPAQTYHYRLVATNSVGSGYGQDQIFFTTGPNAGFALSFDGLNDYASAPAINPANGRGLTLEAWIKPASLTDTPFSEIIRQQGGGTIDWLVAFQTNGTLLTFGLGTGATYQELRVPVNPADFTDGNWHHIAATYDSSTKSLYKDGILIGSAGQGGVVSFAGNNVAIGASVNGTLASEFFNGVIDEVRVWNIARSQAQINQSLNLGLIGSDAGLLAYWRFDEGAGSSAFDATGHGYTATLANGTGWVPSTSPVLPFTATPSISSLLATNITSNSVLLTGSVNPDGLPTTVYFEHGPSAGYGFVTGQTNLGGQLIGTAVTAGISSLPQASPYHWRLVAWNSAGTNYGADHVVFTSGPGPGASIKLDGVNDYVSISPLNLSAGNGLTLETWIRPLNLAGPAFSEIFRQEGPGFLDWLFSFQNHGTILSFGLTAGGAYQELQAAVDPGYFTDGSWHHVAATYDGTAKRIYVDGALVTLTNQTGTVSGGGTISALGANGGGTSEFLNGSVDEARIWSVGRNAGQIAQFLDSGLTGTEPGLAGYWRFDEGSGTISIDSTGKGNTATLKNGVPWVATDVPIIPTNAPPFVTTVSAGNFTATGASLNGSVNPNGLPTLAYFEYGTNTSYGSQSAATDAGAGLVFAPFNVAISNLQPAQAYDYRAVASNSAGVTFGSNKSFSTPGASAGNALSFDGVNDYVGIPLLNLSGGNTLTIEAWIKPADLTTPAYAEIIRQTGFSVNDWLLSFQNHGTVLAFGLTAGGAYQELHVAINPANYTDGNWHHVAAVYDGTTKHLYIDGVQVGTTNQSGNVSFGGSNHTIGSSGGASEFFNGLIDEVRFWSTARTVTQLQQNMNQSLTGQEAGLVGYWRFDEGSGTTTADSSGSGNNGTLINGPLWVASTAPINPFNGPPSISSAFAGQISTSSVTFTGTVIPGGQGATIYFEYGSTTNYGTQTGPMVMPAGLVAASVTNVVSGLPAQKLYHWHMVAYNGAGTVVSSDRTFVTTGPNAGTALSFNGANSYLGLPLVNLGSGNALTIEAWIKPADLVGSTYSDIIRQTGSTGPDWMLAFQGHGTILAFGVRTASGYQELHISITPSYYTDGNWHHVAAVYDGSTKRVYVDGVQIGFNSQSGNVAFASTASSLGASLEGGPGEFFNGLIDEVSLWRVARSADQIAQFMNQSLNGGEPGLAAYWRLDEGAGTTTVDSSGNGKTATLINGPVWVASTAPITPFSGPPSITRAFTLGATTNSAMLVGTIIPGAQAAQVHFEYGLTTNYDNQTTPVALGAGVAGIGVTNTLSGLQPLKLYHWRVVASNDAGLTAGSDRAFVSSDASGNFALGFNGTSSFVDLPVLNFSSSNKLTIEAWLLPFDIISLANSEIIRQQANGIYPDYLLAFQNNGSILSFGLTAGGNYLELHVPVSPANFTDGNWHHVAAVYNGTSSVLYMDGTQIGSTNLSGNISFAGNQNEIGANNGQSEFFNGAIDEVRLWSAARSQSQISQNMNLVSTGINADLQAYWRFSEGAGIAAADSSGNGRGGTLKNGAAWFAPGAPVLLLAPPAITNFSPLLGQYGATVTITGNNFLTANSVTINGIATSFSVNSDFSMTLTVPAGASTGPIGITTAYGHVDSAASFVVDNTPPFLNFQSPAGGTFVSNLSQVNGLASDSSGIQSMAVYIQRASDSKFWTGTNWGIPTPLTTAFSNGNWSYGGTAPAGGNLPDGSYTLFASAVDNAGNESGINIKTTVHKSGSVVPIGMLGNGHAVIRFPGAAGQTYRVQASTDLVHWTTLSSVTVDTSGVLQFEDVDAPGNQFRFYRTVSP
jgi:hypothetical protein